MPNRNPPPPPNGGGRARGSRNKVTHAAKQLVLEALDEVGGKDWLVALAREEPKSFAQLVSKLIPQVQDVKVSSDVVLKLNVGKRKQEAILINDIRSVGAAQGKPQGRTKDLSMGPTGLSDEAVEVRRGHAEGDSPTATTAGEASRGASEAIPPAGRDRRPNGARRHPGSESPDSESPHSGVPGTRAAVSEETENLGERRPHGDGSTTDGS